jgi:patatin-like phospholipase/acyl hydrolase
LRGHFSLQILRKIEQIAEQASGNRDIRLCDCFDYIAGTSTGGIIAAALAIGLRVSEVEAFYLENASAMFTRNSNWIKRFTTSKYESAILQAKLQEVFGLETTLGSSKLRTLLMLMMLNASTSSPWPVSSNPNAKYNDIDVWGAASNLHLPLWQLVRASAAAPFFFAPEAISVGDQTFLFFDGALTSFNNPAFKLFQMATLQQYGLQWPTGRDNMLLVSVGTGLLANDLASATPDSVNFLEALPAAMQALLHASTNEQDLLCRCFGDVISGDPIDSEVGSMMGASSISGEALFTYARYNADLSAKSLSRINLQYDKSVSFDLDSIASIQPCIEIGKYVAEMQVSESHFRQFWAPV